jgi:hypothetical protein
VVELSVIGGIVRAKVIGWRKLLTFIAGIDIALDCIVHAGLGDPGLPHFQPGDRRTLGASIPGVFALGRFSMGKPPRKAFLDLRRSSEQVVVLELKNATYDLLMVEVADARHAVAQIDAARISFERRIPG